MSLEKDRQLSDQEWEQKREQQLQAEKKAHPCHGCRWAKWDEKLVFCFVPNCIKGIEGKAASPLSGGIQQTVLSRKGKAPFC